MTDSYQEINRAAWDERAPADRFRADPAFISDVVRFDLPLLGDVTGLRGVHLQCHIGTDALSLARLGARMTGLDFSPVAIAAARQLADELGQAVGYSSARDTRCCGHWPMRGPTESSRSSIPTSSA